MAPCSQSTQKLQCYSSRAKVSWQVSKSASQFVEDKLWKGQLRVRITIRTAAGVDTRLCSTAHGHGVDQYSSPALTVVVPALTVVVLCPVGGDRARRSHINLDLHLDLAGLYSPGSRRGLQPRFSPRFTAPVRPRPFDLDLDLAGVLQPRFSPGFTAPVRPRPRPRPRRGFTAPVLAGVYSPGSNLDSSSGPLNSSSR
jgi:hypothetical protein